jgi:hypothetical protein
MAWLPIDRMNAHLPLIAIRGRVHASDSLPAAASSWVKQPARASPRASMDDAEARRSRLSLGPHSAYLPRPTSTTCSGQPLPKCSLAAQGLATHTPSMKSVDQAPNPSLMRSSMSLKKRRRPPDGPGEGATLRHRQRTWDRSPCRLPAWRRASPSIPGCLPDRTERPMEYRENS